MGNKNLMDYFEGKIPAPGSQVDLADPKQLLGILVAFFALATLAFLALGAGRSASDRIQRFFKGARGASGSQSRSEWGQV